MKIKKTCIICNKEFFTFTYHTDRGHGKYCSAKCMTIDYRKNKIKIICRVCGKEKYKSPSQKNRKYCSHNCYHKSQVGTKRPSHSEWMKNNKIYHPPYLSKEHRQKLSGENSPRWKGGISSIYHRVRRLPEFYKWRLKVYARDNFTCQDCKKSGIRLEAHHKIGFAKILSMFGIKDIEQALRCKLLWNISNGETLCRKCHKNTKSYGRNNLAV